MGKLYDRIANALKQDNTIAVRADALEKVQGFPVEYFEYLGITKGDLRKLEAKGLALRGYSPTQKGNLVRWVLVAEPGESNETVQHLQTNANVPTSIESTEVEQSSEHPHS